MTQDRAPYALRLSAVTKVFGGVKALDRVDFSVRAGEVHCLAGENGCGKSTLIKIVTGVYRPETIAGFEVFGQPVSAMTPVQARALGISVIWQDLALFPNMSVAENIAFDDLVGLVPRGVDYARMRARAAAALARLGVALPLEAALESLPIAQRHHLDEALARIVAGQGLVHLLGAGTRDKLGPVQRHRHGQALVEIGHHRHEQRRRLQPRVGGHFRQVLVSQAKTIGAR